MSQILKEFDSGKSTVQGSAYALPGGQRRDDHFSRQGQLVSDLLGVTLPPAPLMDFLIEAYFRSVHWFMVMVHEPTFRARYYQMATSGIAPGSRRGQAAILILVLAIGAKYARKETASALFPLVDLAAMQKELIGAVQGHFIDIMEEGDIEAVQVCILLSSFYLYNERPGLAFIVLGTGVRCAHAMGLHKESMWRTLSIPAREHRRRIWWALFTYDRYVSRSPFYTLRHGRHSVVSIKKRYLADDISR